MKIIALSVSLQITFNGRKSFIEMFFFGLRTAKKKTRIDTYISHRL